MTEAPSPATAIRIGPGVRDVRIIDTEISGFPVGIDAGAGAHAEIVGGSIQANVGVVAREGANVRMVGVELRNALADIIMHPSAQVTLLDVVNRLRVIIEGAPQVPASLLADLRRATDAPTKKARLRALWRVIERAAAIYSVHDFGRAMFDGLRKILETLE